jgi:hypothetical protein
LVLFSVLFACQIRPNEWIQPLHRKLITLNPLSCMPFWGCLYWMFGLLKIWKQKFKIPNN